MNAPYVIEKRLYNLNLKKYNATIYDYLASILRYCVGRKKDRLKTYIWGYMGMFPYRNCKFKGDDFKFLGRGRGLKCWVEFYIKNKSFTNSKCGL